jgi:hypothetical protein
MMKLLLSAFRTVTQFSFALLFVALAFGSASAAGIPEISPDYAADVRDWWAKHPMNDKSPAALKAIESPAPIVELKSGDSINAAVEKLPATGGTLRLAAGKYEPFRIVGRSHVHIIGPAEGEAVITGRSYLAVCEEAMDYVKFDKLTSRFDTTITTKDNRVWNLYRNPTRDFYLKNLVFDGEGVTTVDFPGVGIQGLGGALGFKGVRDAVVERCTFRNYLDTKNNLQHCGLAWGHYGLTNIWFRGCHFIGAARYAVYFDGAHGCGLIGCKIEGAGCKDGGLLFLANHDFTDDRNENGRIDADEEKCAKFLVLSGNTFEGNFSTPIRITGMNCLITGNKAAGRMLELVGVYPTGEIARRTWNYGNLGIRVTDNQAGTCARAVLNVFLQTKDLVREVEQTPAEGRHTLSGNTIEKTPKDVLITAMKP